MLGSAYRWKCWKPDQQPTTLKTHQLNHMNLMIQTLLAFVGGANQEELTNGLEMARKEHDLYSLEIVRLLGVTLAPITATPP